MHRVAVLMSTFNGELYVLQQIESILQQQNVDVSIFIRDDGSVDNTIKVISSICEERILLTEGNNVGVGNSFMQLLYSVPDCYDYYAFSDQDDIWYQNKLVMAINKLTETGKRLYLSNQNCVDKNARFMFRRHDAIPRFDPVAVLSQNNGTGCTMVFDKEFRNMICDAKRIPSEKLLKVRIHDVWITMVGAISNNIVYDNNAYISYRQHDNNVVGVAKQNMLKRSQRKINKLRNPELLHGRYILAREIAEKYWEYAHKYPIIIKCAAYKDSLGNKISLLKEYRLFSEYNSPIIYYLYVMLGFF